MRKRLHALRRRALSALLAAVMIMSLAPAAFAATVEKNSKCPGNSEGQNTGEAHDWILDKAKVVEATCHDKGSLTYYCKYCNNTYTEEIETNSNHVYIYSDNADGKTHIKYCRYHQDKTTSTENHDFKDGNGRCVDCGAIDYNSVSPSFEKDQTVYVAIGEENAKLSMEDITLNVSNVDITNEYTITYAWFYQGKMVGEGSTYTLDSSFTGKEADYTFTCVMLAAPKNGVAAQSVNATCTISVLVRELIVARATVNVKDNYLDFDDTTDSMADSIYDQIYDAVYDASSNGTPDYIIFGEQPESKVGRLDISSSSARKYSFSSKDSYPLEDVRFELADDGRTGTYTINFTAWDTKGKEFPGVLTIYVEKSLSDASVLYSGVKGQDVALAAEDFQRFWEETHSSGSLEYVVFKTPSDGNLYYDGSRIDTGKNGDELYRNPTKSRQMDLDELVFTPRKSFTGTVTVDFTATGTNNKNKTVDLSGTLTILLTDGEVEDISLKVPTGGSLTLNEEDFLSVYQGATGSKTKTFYIQLLSLPESGALYMDRSSSRSGTELKNSNKASYQFHYSSSQNKEINDLTYLPGAAAKDSAAYAAYDSKGEPLYVGRILFERDDLTVEYTANSAAGVSFKANDFRTLLGSGSNEVITAVSFSAPTAGTLYYNYVGGVGTKVTASDKYYTTGTTLSVSSLTYVPEAGQAAGEVTIPFTAYDLSNNKVSGEVKIDVPQAIAKPGATDPEKPDDKPNTPTVTFSDVPKNANTEWYYTAVTELAGAGIINGYEDGTFKPANEVTYGQALKLIMMAAGYEDLSRKGSGWAQGFLDKALEDGLLSQSVNLDRKITRSVIADIAYKALKLDKPTISSPFYDSANEGALALYEAGIVKGEERSGNLMFFGNYSITRREMAVIIWRMNSYAQAKG